MKRFLPATLCTILWAHAALATTANFINYGNFIYVDPPDAAPQIDASNFVNYGVISISNLNIVSIAPVLPYETWNTLTYSNFNLISGDSGFRFDFYDSAAARYRPASIFFNAGSVNETNATIFGATYMLATATNIIDRGLLSMGGPGLLKLTGDHIDLTRGTLAAIGNETSPLAGVRDVYWGAATNRFFPEVDPADFFAPVPVTTILGQQYVTTFQFFQLTNGFTTYVRTNTFSPLDQTVDILFLGQTNSAITTQVAFSPDFFFNPWGSEKVVQWQGVVTNRTNGELMTNYLYLDDTLNFFGDPFPDATLFQTWLLQTPSPLPFYGLFAAARFHPINYAITHAFPFFTNLTLMPPVAFDPTIFAGTNPVVWLTNTGWAATITAQAYSPDPTIQNSGYTNVPGRMEIIANRTLDLTRARVDQESYLRLDSTNQFLGTAGARIVSAFSDFNLATTNVTLTLSNLTTPTVPRMCGEVQVWSGRWTNTQASGLVTTYNVSVVDSRLAPEQPSQIQDLTLRSTNLIVCDVLNIFHNLLFDGERLTVATNALNAPTASGEINLTSPNLFWAPSLPQLRYLTNYGRITAGNSTFFGGARRPPWFTGSFDEPYEALVNHGLMSAQGSLIWAKYFEYEGTANSGVGPLSIQFDYGIATNSVLTSSNADVSLTGGFMLVSNVVVQAGRAINLTVTNILSDGIPNLALLPATNQLFATVTNGNGWQTSFGLNLARRPVSGDLLGTTITNFGFNNVVVPIIWAGEDRGLFDPANSTSSGFLNNAAIGNLVLDGQTNSQFAFQGPDSNGNYALYVDRIEFRNWAATNVDNQNNLLAVSVAPNMKVYFAQALQAGRPNPEYSEKLSGQNGFIWLSNYNYGYFSSTNIVYQDGTTNRLNTALATSCDLVSNTNLPPAVNCSPNFPGPIWPIPVWSPTATDVPSFQPPPPSDSVPTNSVPPGSTNSVPPGPPTNSVPPGPTNSASGPPTLDAPSAASSDVLSNAFVQGTYVGLFSDTNGVAAASSGYFSAKTTASGAFSAKVNLGGRTYSLSGRFNNSTGLGTATMARGPLSIQLWLVPPAGDQMGGWIRGPGGLAQLVAHRQVFTKSSHPAADYKGNYTLLIPPDTNGPSGYGFGTVKVDAAGNVKWAGTLSDGSKVSASSVVSSEGLWALYDPLYTTRGCLIGWLQFSPGSATDLGGQCLWLKPAGVSPRYYPHGFTNDVQAVGSRYSRPVGATAIPLNGGMGTLTLSGGGLHSPVMENVSLDRRNRLTSLGDPTLKLRLDASSGLFSGSVIISPLGKFFFQGALLQEQNFGAGYFLGSSQGGGIYLSPAP